MNPNNLKIGLRLALGFGAVLALAAAIVAVAWLRLASTGADLQQAVAYEQRAKLMSDWAHRTELNISRTIAIAKSAGQPQVEAHFAPLMKETSAQIGELQKELEHVIDSEQGKTLLAAIGAQRKLYLEARGRLGGLVKQSDFVAAEALLTDTLLPASQKYLAEMAALQKFQIELAETGEVRLKQGLDATRWTLLVLLAASLSIGTLMAWAITRSITRPLGQAVGVAQVIAAGDLSQPVRSDRRDEFGNLLRALGQMQAALRTLVVQVRGSTDSIETASAEIASGNLDLSARTEQTASSLQQTASSMEQLTATVRQSADAARQANQLASSAAEVASRGGAIVSQVIATMDEIAASSTQIADIVGTIDGIAFQTNILALNAAVEAARAGEQGRGFAVVASEVRSLAQRSAEAAKEIRGLIGSSVDKVQTGSRRVADAGSTMRDIVAAVQRVADIVGEITAAASEQSAGIGQVNTAVSELDRMTQQNAALVEQSAAAAESLKEQAGRLARVVGTFQLGRPETVG